LSFVIGRHYGRVNITRSEACAGLTLLRRDSVKSSVACKCQLILVLERLKRHGLVEGPLFPHFCLVVRLRRNSLRASYNFIPHRLMIAHTLTQSSASFIPRLRRSARRCARRFASTCPLGVLPSSPLLHCRVIQDQRRSYGALRSHRKLKRGGPCPNAKRPSRTAGPSKSGQRVSIQARPVGCVEAGRVAAHGQAADRVSTVCSSGL